MLELQELFYDFKNESLEQIPDDDLIAKMRSLFDDPAEGDLGYLEEALFEGLARHVREEAAVGLTTAEDDASGPRRRPRRRERADARCAPLQRLGLGRRDLRARLGGLELARRIEDATDEPMRADRSRCSRRRLGGADERVDQELASAEELAAFQERFLRLLERRTAIDTMATARPCPSTSPSTCCAR